MNKKIIGIEDPSTLYKIYDQIFDRRKGIEVSFTSRIQKMGFLNNIDFKLGLNEARALVKAATLVGDDSFYLSLTERSDDPGIIRDWLIPLDAIDAYVEENSLYFVVLANALYSPNARWGIFLCIDSFGAIGGPPEFVNTFYQELGISNEQIIRDFIREDGREIAFAVLSQFFSHEETQMYIDKCA